MNGLEKENISVGLESQYPNENVQKGTLEEELAAFKERLKKIAEADSEFFLRIATEAEKTAKFSIEKNGKLQGNFEFHPLENALKFNLAPGLSFDEKKAAFAKGMDACSRSMSGKKMQISLPKGDDSKEVFEAVLADEINAEKVKGLFLDHPSLTPENRNKMLQSLIDKGVDPTKLRNALHSASSVEGIKQLDLLTKPAPSVTKTATDSIASATPFLATQSQGPATQPTASHSSPTPGVK